MREYDGNPATARLSSRSNPALACSPFHYLTSKSETHSSGLSLSNNSFSWKRKWHPPKLGTLFSSADASPRFRYPWLCSTHNIGRAMLDQSRCLTLGLAWLPRPSKHRAATAGSFSALMLQFWILPSECHQSAWSPIPWIAVQKIPSKLHHLFPESFILSKRFVLHRKPRNLVLSLIHIRLWKYLPFKECLCCSHLEI